MQLPGVGPTTATALVAMIGHGQEFKRGRQPVCSFAVRTLHQKAMPSHRNTGELDRRVAAEAAIRLTEREALVVIWPAEPRNNTGLSSRCSLPWLRQLGESIDGRRCSAFDVHHERAGERARPRDNTIHRAMRESAERCSPLPLTRCSAREARDLAKRRGMSQRWIGGCHCR
jgi:hypothetical protein